MNTKKIIISALVLGFSVAPFASTAQAEIGIENETQSEMRGPGPKGRPAEARLAASTTINARMEDRKGPPPPRNMQGTTTKREEMKDKMQEQKENRQDKKDDRRKQIVIRNFENTLRVYTKALDNVEDLSKRLDSRISKIEASSTASTTGTTAAKAANALAKTKIAEARAILANIKVTASTTITTIGTTTATTTIQVQVKDLDAKFKKAKEAIKAAHAQVVKGIAALKGGNGSKSAKDTKVHATTTATTTINQ
jgi:hypothetical protein